MCILIETTLEIRREASRRTNEILDMVEMNKTNVGSLEERIDERMQERKRESASLKVNLEDLERKLEELHLIVSSQAHSLRTDISSNTLDESQLNVIETNTLNTKAVSLNRPGNLLDPAPRSPSLRPFSFDLRNKPALQVSDHAELECSSSSDNPNRISGLTHLVNENNEQALRRHGFLELDVSPGSKSNLAMGLITLVEFEATEGVGRYLLVEVMEQSYMYPTHDTKEVITRNKNGQLFDLVIDPSLSKPMVLEPATMEKSGRVWRLMAKGSIAIPA